MIKQVLTKWLWTLSEYLMIYPAFLLLSGLLLPKDTAVAFTLLLPFNILAGIVIASLLGKFRNLIIALIVVLYTAGFAWLWQFIFTDRGIIEIIIVSVSTAFFLIRGVRAGKGSENQMLFLYSGGLLIHGILLFLFNRSPLLKHFFTAAVIAAVIYVIVGLPLVNRHFLIHETRQKNSLKRIPGSVARGNIIIVSVILAGIVLLSLWRFLLDGLNYLSKAASWVIGRLMEFISSFFVSTEQKPGGAGQMEMPPVTEANPIVSLVSNGLILILLLFVLYFFIRYLVKNHKRLIAHLLEFLSRIFSRFQKWSSFEQSYIDRQESLLKSEFRKNPSIFKRLFMREPNWRDMKDNSSRIRYIYTKFISDSIKRGFSFNPAETPVETIGRIPKKGKESERSHDLILKTYNEVRYGEKEQGDETVRVLKDSYIR